MQKKHRGVTNLSSLENFKKETINTTVKYIKNLFRFEKLKKENGEIKDRILRDTTNVFRLEKKK